MTRVADRPWFGILLFCGTTMCFAALDTGAKYLARDYHPLQIVWGRYFFQFALLLPFILRRGVRRSFASARPRVQVARGLLISLITFMFFAAIGHLPLVDAQAISFTMPLILTALAFFLLGEKVGPRRWTAVAVGFAGVLLIVRPTGETLHWAAVLCLACAALNACFHLMTRTLAASDAPDVGIVYAGTIGTAIFSAIAPFVWRTPDIVAWLIFVMIGGLGALGHFWLSKAYIYTRAVVLAPYVYLQIVWVMPLGYLLFDDVPAPSTLAGSGIVVAAGLYVFYRERKLKGDA
jgi:drug/metabolite transporter (DMT)-like permease